MKGPPLWNSGISFPFFLLKIVICYRKVILLTISGHYFTSRLPWLRSKFATFNAVSQVAQSGDAELEIIPVENVPATKRRE
jgi:hypothetical protein